MDRNSAFVKTLDKIGAKLKSMESRAEYARMFYGAGDMAAAYAQAFKLEASAEQAALLSRALPAYTGHPNAGPDIEKVMRNNIPVRIGFTREGWFSLQIPLLLPKKQGGSVEYIRSFLYPALRDFFLPRPSVRYTDCVIIYRHVYDRRRPERRRRDHDNIETNTVTDAVALYVMPDDDPSVCTHYYCGAAGGRERTEVYVVPKTDFQDWLTHEPEMPEESPALYETMP
ncbi:MAG: DUF6100 family protein [Peptococcaceae bacterium]|jgi:hypothetical protein|nr:DUF6100 family protein [Peptococcaceae bacterium]